MERINSKDSWGFYLPLIYLIYYPALTRNITNYFQMQNEHPSNNPLLIEFPIEFNFLSAGPTCQYPFAFPFATEFTNPFLPFEMSLRIRIL